MRLSLPSGAWISIDGDKQINLRLGPIDSNANIDFRRFIHGRYKYIHRDFD